MHTDHIGGLLNADGPALPNASHGTAAAEYDFWSKPGLNHPVASGVAALVTPIVDHFEFVEDGARIASGITTIASFGHTLGHMWFMLDRGARQLLLTADLANHYVWSIASPDRAAISSAAGIWRDNGALARPSGQHNLNRFRLGRRSALYPHHRQSGIEVFHDCPLWCPTS
ncbi:hypothetical protein [Ruegeria denitrificans]|uniref:hypothetical protein n=1 Tax=Ruegeria denitrificans TaxID=1715692 RepID=UPI00071C20F1|nr:hypothetical protein [Ruegeria denitrificans]